MKKLSLLLAVLLIVGLVAGCGGNKEDNDGFAPDETQSATSPIHEALEAWREKYVGVPGYDVSIPLDSAWEMTDESVYDLEMVKEDVTLSVIVFTKLDFEEMPEAEELYERCNKILFNQIEEVTTVEDKASYQVEEMKISSQLFASVDGDTTTQYYCFLVEFGDEAGSVAWLGFTAEESVMTQKKAELKAIVDEMDSDGDIPADAEWMFEVEE